jgi:hypothetical protein
MAYGHVLRHHHTRVDGRNGKPVARRGAKLTDLREVAELPKSRRGCSR